eukprot:GHUV01038729.1.p2 GENE.GHUV01038729.1~~GHUV01038729.1.p2  ORF type:complete len:116 (+),score=39.42 GHUV01038729.1:318-665(+)
MVHTYVEAEMLELLLQHLRPPSESGYAASTDSMAADYTNTPVFAHHYKHHQIVCLEACAPMHASVVGYQHLFLCLGQPLPELFCHKWHEGVQQPQTSIKGHPQSLLGSSLGGSST